MDNDDVTTQIALARSAWAAGHIEAARRRAAYSATRTPAAAVLDQEFCAQLASWARPSAIAGQFYAQSAQQLAQEVDAHLQTQPAVDQTQAPKVLIAPHAGHVYSGQTAGLAYARLKPFAARIKRVVLLGPAHRVYFQGVALPGTGAYQTPLGSVLLDTLAADAMADLPFVCNRPDAHAAEHSLEVHLPFLQRVLPHFVLLPLVVGDATSAQVAQVLERLWDGPQTLIVISTDLSHFHTYQEAQTLDTSSCEKIMRFDATLDTQQACGCRPVNGLLEIAQRKNLRIEHIQYCNSGDTAGDKQRVVGYASFALYETQADADAQKLSDEQGQYLLQQARAALNEAVGAVTASTPVPVASTALQQPGASFVTLTANGQLRGCIGSLQAQRPLLEDVRANARAAALNDPRFAPVGVHEAPKLRVEVSVLTPPQTLRFANESHAIYQLEPGIDGVVLQYQQYRSTYLPQVWEQIPEPRAFLAHLKVKAGLPFDFWLPDIALQRYRVQKFVESV